MAANPLRKPDPKSDYDVPPEQPRESPARPEWPMEESRMGSSAPSGWAGYMIGAVVLVAAILVALYFGFSGKTTNTSTETTAPSGPVQTIPKEVTPPAANEQQKSAPGGATIAPQTTEPQSTQPQNTAPQPGTTKP